MSARSSPVHARTEPLRRTSEHDWPARPTGSVQDPEHVSDAPLRMIHVTAANGDAPTGATAEPNRDLP